MPDNIPNITFTVEPNEGVSVPIDDTLSIAGQAADAKAVGDALALKADKSELATSIKVNGQSADLQGEIIVTAAHVPMDANETSDVAEEIAALKALTGEDIPVNDDNDAPSIAEALEAAAAGVVVQDGTVSIAGQVADGSTSVSSMEVNGQDLPLRDDGAVRSVNGVRGDSTGNVRITHVETADNLVADDAQQNVAAYVLRTSGGSTPIASGKAWLAQVRGAMTHTGVVAEVLELTVNAATREAGQTPITATVNAATFRAAVNDSCTLTLTYEDGAWDTDPSSLGITVTGTPIDEDEIEVEYVKASRGQITPASPATFRSTGWNLYNHSAGYARVVKYSQTYGFRVAGTYTSLSFSETVNGARTAITPINGAFSVPGDGYVWVTGGNATSTAIYMTWSDWTAGYSGSFAAYSESTISLSTLMSEHFPNGLCAVGGVADVIDLSLQTATIAIERMEYSAANIAALETAGRAYEADEDYIYAVLATPETVTGINISSQYTVNDHGMEYVTGTDAAPVLLTLYGQNLKDKLRTDVVTISQQSLTSSQQSQVRTNIGAVAKSGDTMTGNLTMPHLNVQSGSRYTNIHLRDSNGVPRGLIWSDGESGRIFFRSINPNVASGDVESIYTEYFLYQSTLTSGSVSYKIYSERDTIPVDHGGTGATGVTNAVENLGVALAMNDDEWTLATMYPKMTKVPVPGSALLWVSSTVSKLLSGNKINSYCTIVASRTNANSWRFLAFSNDGNIYNWGLSGWTSASATPTIGTVYKLTGTAI